MVHDFNRRYSTEARSFMEMVRDIPALASEAFEAMTHPQVLHVPLLIRFRLVLYLVVGVLYTLAPFDLVRHLCAAVLKAFLRLPHFLFHGIVSITRRVCGLPSTRFNYQACVWSSIHTFSVE